MSAVEPTSYCKALHSSVGFIPNQFCNFLLSERPESGTTDRPQIFLWIGGDCTQWLWDIPHTKNYCSVYITPNWKLKGGTHFVQPKSSVKEALLLLFFQPWDMLYILSATWPFMFAACSQAPSANALIFQHMPTLCYIFGYEGNSSCTDFSGFLSK